MRRFALSTALVAAGGGFGLDAECWADNTTSDVHGNVHVQDFYQVMRPSLIPDKIKYIEAQMRRAADVSYPPATAEKPASPSQIFLNFLSASNFGDIRCWPRHIAHRVNPAVRQYLCSQHAQAVCAQPGQQPSCSGDGGLGIVVCDWVGHGGDWDIVDFIIGLNSTHLRRERSPAS